MPQELSAIDNAASKFCVLSAEAGEGVPALFNGRVCLEPSPTLVGGGCCTTDGRLSFERATSAEAERTGWPACLRGKGVDFRRRPSGGVCKPPYAAPRGKAWGGEQ